MTEWHRSSGRLSAVPRSICFINLYQFTFDGDVHVHMREKKSESERENE